MSNEVQHRQQGIEAIRVAMLLFERYRHDAAALGSLALASMDERLLALDQNYAGVWEKLDQAAASLDQAGLDLSDYRELRERTKEAHLGYTERQQLQVSLAGVEQRTTISISRKRFVRIQQALQALQAQLPGEQWQEERDEEVERFIAGEHSPLRILKLGAWVLGAAAVVTLLLLGFQWLRPADYGEHSKAIARLQHQLDAKPCHKETAVKLAELLNRARAYQAALEHAAAFFKTCGEHRRLRWATFTAHKRLKDWRGALGEVNRLVQAVPRDRDYRWWRAEVYQQLGQLEQAAADYAQAVALQPDLRQIPERLALLLQRLERPCEAAFWLDSLGHFDPRQRPALQQRLSQPWSEPRCAALLGRGEASVAAPAGAGAPVATVQINGQAAGRFEVQQDALWVMLSRATAHKLGLKPAKEAEWLRTPQGFYHGQRVRLDGLALGQARAARVPALVVPRLPRQLAGIVGRSFLARFRVTSDSNGLNLAPRSPTQLRP